MLIRNLAAMLVLFLFAGCAASYAPKEWLSETEKIQEEAYGGWFTVYSDTAKTRQNKKGIICAGELIGIDSLNVFLLGDSLLMVPKNKIGSCVLEIDQKDRELYTGWSCFGAVSTLSNGIYLAITLPIWIAAGLFVNLEESYRDRYEAENPDEKYWHAINIYSRFPQGLPSEIDISILQPKPAQKE